MIADPHAMPVPQVRPIDHRRMAVWRKSQIAVGIARAALRHFKAGRSGLPIIHRDVVIREHHGSIHLGHLSEIHDRVVLSAIGSEGAPARLSVGSMTSIWYGTVISARAEISIGAHCAISWNCSILDEDMHEIIELPGTNKPRGPRPVQIADHVWIGAGAVVLKGVHIGENAIVAAGAIVTHDVPPETLVAGAPARVIRRVAGWR